MEEKSYRVEKKGGKITKEEIPRLKEKVFFTRVPEEMYREVAALADDEERTITMMFKRLIREGLKHYKKEK